MNPSSSAVGVGAALALAALAAAPAGAQAVGVAKNFTTYGNNFAVSQTDYNVASTYNATLVTTASKTDDLERLYNPGGATAGPLTIAIDANSPIKTTDANNTLHGLADASQGNGAGGFTIFNGDGSVSTGTAAAVAAAKVAQETIVDFTFNDPAAQFGETLTGLGLTTLGTGDGREYYDVTFSYSTDGVNFIPFLAAQDSGAALPATGGTDEFLQASGISIANVKALQLIERPNINTPTNPYYIQGSAVAEVDAFFTPSAPAAVPEASSVVSLGTLLALGLGGLMVVAKRKKTGQSV